MGEGVFTSYLVLLNFFWLQVFCAFCSTRLSAVWCYFLLSGVAVGGICLFSSSVVNCRVVDVDFLLLAVVLVPGCLGLVVSC
jgi:hypothetical protein